MAKKSNRILCITALEERVHEGEPVALDAVAHELQPKAVKDASKGLLDGVRLVYNQLHQRFFVPIGYELGRRFFE